MIDDRVNGVDAQADDDRRVLLMRRGGEILIAFNFSGKAQSLELPFEPAVWTAMIDTGAKIEGNRIELPPEGFALYKQLLSSRA